MRSGSLFNIFVFCKTLLPNPCRKNTKMKLSAELPLIPLTQGGRERLAKKASEREGSRRGGERYTPDCACPSDARWQARGREGPVPHVAAGGELLPAAWRVDRARKEIAARPDSDQCLGLTAGREGGTRGTRKAMEKGLL